LFGDKFTELFGADILSETRQALKTRDGYKVNPILSALRKCRIWDLADTLILAEQESFGSELINSLNSNNWETMSLFSFANRKEIPIKWVKLLLDRWSIDLFENSWIQRNFPSYIEHYLGLVECYTAELGEYEKLGKVVQALTESTAQSPYNSETFAKLDLTNICGNFGKSCLKDIAINSSVITWFNQADIKSLLG
jgi:hypothetical protein